MYSVLSATRAGVLGDLALVAAKTTVAISSGSAALAADAAHSIGDLVSSTIVHACVLSSKAPPDEDHSFGHGKIQSLGTLGVSSALLLTSGSIGAHSLNMLMSPEPAAALPEDAMLSAAAVGLIAIAAKEALFRYTMAVAEKNTDNTLLQSSAWHHRADAMSSVVVVLGAGGAHFGMPLLDPLAGLVLSGMIAREGCKVAFVAVQELMDAEIPMKERLKFTEAVVQAIGAKPSRLRTRQMGPYLFLDIAVDVPSKMSASAAHQVAEHVRRGVLRSDSRVAEVNVHVDPVGAQHFCHDTLMDKPALDVFDSGRELLPLPNLVEEDVKRAIFNPAQSEGAVLGISELQCYYLNDRLMVKVDIILPPDLRIHEAHEIAAQVRKRVETACPAIFAVDVDLELDLESQGDQLGLRPCSRSSYHRPSRIATTKEGATLTPWGLHLAASDRLTDRSTDRKEGAKRW